MGTLCYNYLKFRISVFINKSDTAVSFGRSNHGSTPMQNLLQSIFISFHFSLLFSFLLFILDTVYSLCNMDLGL